MPSASTIAAPPPSPDLRPVDLINSGIYFSQEAHASLAKCPGRAAHLLRHSASRMIAAAEQIEGSGEGAACSR